MTSRDIYSHHPRIGYTFTPNLKARIPHESGGYLLRTNNLGFRSNQEFTQKKNQSSRILVFGDSFTAGDGVSNHKRYTDILQSSLSDVEVLNFGLSGSGTDQQFLVFEEFASEIEADLVILAIQVENIRRNVSHYREFQSTSNGNMALCKPYFETQSDGSLSLRQVPVPKAPIPLNELDSEQSKFLDKGGKFEIVRKLVNKMGSTPKRVIQSITKIQPLPEYDDKDGHPWKLTKAIIESWLAKIEQTVIVFPIPLYQYLEGLADSRAYRSRFTELNLGKNGLLCDPFEVLYSYSGSEKRAFRFKKDIHPTPQYHQALAKYLEQQVNEIL